MLKTMRSSRNRAAIGVAGLLAILCGCSSQSERAIKIAVIGPLTGPIAARGTDLMQAARMAVEEANAAGGVNGRRIELVAFDDQDQPGRARDLAEQIAAGPAVAVLGHVASSAGIAAGAVYQAREIPAVTAAASSLKVTSGNPWFFRLFQSAAGQGKFLADYAVEELEAKQLVVIREKGTAGEEFASALRDRAKDQKVKIATDLEFAPVEAKDAAAMEALANNVAKLGKKPIVVLGSQYGETPAILTALRDKIGPFTAIGYSSLATEDLDARFPEKDATQKTPGYYTEGFLVAAPQLGDVAEAQQNAFAIRYRMKYGAPPNPEAVRSYEGARLILQAVAAKKVSGTAPERRADRAKIQEWLAALKTPDSAVPSVAGPVYFDAERNTQRDLTIGVFHEGHLIAAPIQFTAVTDPDRVPGWEELVADNKVVGKGAHMYVKTPVVYGGIELNSVDDIDVPNTSFSLDFFLWFRYEDGLSVDIHQVEFPNVVSGATLGREVGLRDRNGYTTITYHVKGVFKGDYEFSKYPFDKQDLQIPIQFHKSNNYTLILAYSPSGLKKRDKQSGDAVSSNSLASGQILSSKLWRLNSRRIFRDVVSYKSFFGDDGGGNQQSGVEVNRLNSGVVIERDVFGFAVKNFLPLVCILIAVLIGYVIAPTVIDSRISIGVTALLTTSVLYQKLASDLPTVTYITAMDYVFFAFFAICVVFLLLTVLGFERAKREAGGTALINRGGFVATILGLGLTLLFVWIRYWGAA